MENRTATNMSFKEVQEKLCNNTEKMVLETMEDLLQMEEFKDVCKCPQCLLDIASYSLNRLPAKYISTPKGNVHAKLEDFRNQVQVDLISTVTLAIKIISKNPRH